MKKKTSKSKKSKVVRRTKSKTARRSKSKKVVRRAKAKKAVRRRKCMPSKVNYTKTRSYVRPPSAVSCMRLAKQYANDRLRYHNKHFCRLGHCRTGARCRSVVYYCYRLRPQGNRQLLILMAKALCKCMAATNPPTYGLVIYNCKKAR